jgi:hypothetical protein
MARISADIYSTGTVSIYIYELYDFFLPFRYGQWPASGEIDIMESRGNLDLTMNGVNIGVEQVT